MSRKNNKIGNIRKNVNKHLKFYIKWSLPPANTLHYPPSVTWMDSFGCLIYAFTWTEGSISHLYTYTAENIILFLRGVCVLVQNSW